MKKAEYCTKASAAVSLAREGLSALPEDRRRILSRFKSTPQAAVLKSVPVWIVSQHKSVHQPGSSIVLYVTVQTGALRSDIVKNETVVLFQNGQHFGKGALDFHFSNGSFKVTARQEMLKLREAEAVWAKNKEKFMQRREAPRFTFFNRPLPAFCNQTPLYVIGYCRSSYSSDVEILVVYALSGKLVCRTYLYENWQKMRNAKPGDHIEIAGSRILITKTGFRRENV